MKTEAEIAVDPHPVEVQLTEVSRLKEIVQHLIPMWGEYLELEYRALRNPAENSAAREVSRTLGEFEAALAEMVTGLEGAQPMEALPEPAEEAPEPPVSAQPKLPPNPNLPF